MRAVLAFSVAAAALAPAVAAHALPPVGAARAGDREARPTYAWCSSEMEAIAEDVCFVDGTREGERRPLVIYLHGLIAKNTDWQWTQERAIAREAKRLGFAAIVPRGPAIGTGGALGYAWQFPEADRATIEPALIQTWTDARRKLEARAGRPFDDVYVVGFSSGAYYASSLALRGKLDVDGYVLLAGGAVSRVSADTRRRPPIFVGVCANDAQTAPGARALGGTLATWGWPSRVDEQPVSHMVTGVHLAHALAYLKGAKPAGR
jgi:predicted esterase